MPLYARFKLFLGGIMNIVGREKEISVLKRCYESPKPEFLAVYGRRRVGKTFLIREYFKDRIIFSLTGAANTDMKRQLSGFDEALAGYRGTPANPAEDWWDAFRRLKQHMIESSQKDLSKGKKVIFIDELPWIATQKSDFISALEHFWNSWGATQPELFLIVCGSATSWMIENIIHDRGGLHNRVTRRLLVEPFQLGECEKYFSEMNVVMNRMQIAETYMICGGIPYYIDYFEQGLSSSQNIDQMFFAKDAPLASEFQNLYASLFRRPEAHLRVVEALGKRGMGLTQKELLLEPGITSGGTLSKVLTELEQCGFIRKYRDFTQKRRGHYYQLTDFFTLFYIKHIRENYKQDEHYWQNQSRKGGQLAWNGLAFERVCIAHIAQIKQRLGITGVSTDVSAWRSRYARPGVQIDLVIDREDNIINLCEMKFTERPFRIDSRYDSALREKREIFREETGTKKALHLTMVTANGVAKDAYRSEIQSEVIMNDLFQPVLTG
jgi:AAA+ ATPase superfamily predicted ATPase